MDCGIGGTPSTIRFSLGATTASWDEFALCASVGRGAETISAASATIKAAHAAAHHNFTCRLACTLVIEVILQPAARTASVRVLANTISDPANPFYMSGFRGPKVSSRRASTANQTRAFPPVHRV